jgi:hypothetical protein
MVKATGNRKYFSLPLGEGRERFFSSETPQREGNWTSPSCKLDPQCLEFILRIADQDGYATNPVQIGLPPDFPEIIHMRAEFKKIKGGEMTALTATESGWTASQM